MHVLALAARVQAATLQRATGIQVDLRRGGTTYATTCAVLTTREYVVLDAEQMPFRKKFSDWIINLATLKRYSDTPVSIEKIQAADEIVITRHLPCDISHLAGKRYTVCPIGNQRHAVEPLDDLGIMVTVHSEEMECD